MRAIRLGMVLVAAGLPLSGQQPDRIPPAVIAGAEAAIAAKLGDSLAQTLTRPALQFARFVRGDATCSDSHFCRPYEAQPFFEIFYRFLARGPNPLERLVPLMIDTTGRVVAGEDLPGVPRCAAEPVECQFPLDSAQVRAIAKRAGLARGIQPWRLRFVWSGRARFNIFADSVADFRWAGGNLESYVWEVTTTTKAGRGWSEGEVLLIDANSGLVAARFGTMSQE